MALTSVSEPVNATVAPSPNKAVPPLLSAFDLLQQVLDTRRHNDALDLVGALVDLGSAPEET